VNAHFKMSLLELLVITEPMFGKQRVSKHPTHELTLLTQ
jgi:hypothetical protein